MNAVVFTIRSGSLVVKILKRDKSPFMGQMELPGGLLKVWETAEDTLKRKLENEVGSNVFFKQFYTFTNPKRDPRVRTVAIGFLALIPSEKAKDLTDFYDSTSLPKMAFDHKNMVKKALEFLKRNLETEFVSHFMPKTFPLNDLQKVYEVVGGKKLDNRNFRKKMIAFGIVKKSKKIQKDVAHRPAVLYEFA